MEYFIPGNVHKLLDQFRFDIDPSSTNEYFTCTICRKLIRDGYESFCGCTYCRDCIYDYVSKGYKYCPGNNKECEKLTLQLEKNVLRSARINAGITKVKVICPNQLCNETGNLEYMVDHLKFCTEKKRGHTFYDLGCKYEGTHKDTIQPFNNSGKSFDKCQPELFSLQGKLKKDKTAAFEVENKYIEMNMAKMKMDDVDMEMEYDNNAGDNIEASIDTLSTAMNLIGIKTNKVTEVLFVVDDFDKLSKSLYEQVLSPYFYSHTNGYKLRLMAYSGRTYGDSETYLSVFIQICKGEYDDSLLWPCRCIFSVAMVDQRVTGVTTHTLTLAYDSAPDNCKCAYNRPINMTNSGHGVFRFISLSELRSSGGLILNDRAIIKCTVTLPSK